MSNLNISPSRRLRELFEYENCRECHRDGGSHEAIPFLGNWFARCKPIKRRRHQTKMNRAAHTITFASDGTARCLWTEAVPLHELGRLEIQRASTVEFNAATQCWEVRLASNPDVVAFSNASRETCLNFERKTLNDLL